MEISARLTDYNKNSICRVCMQSGDHNLFPIFNEIFFGDDTITVADIITECTKYPVSLNDQLPDQICNPCMEAARNAHQFKRQTEEAYCHLKELYDIAWVHEGEKNSNCGGLRAGVITTDKYTQTDKSTVFQCESCPKKFFVETELREHRATIHVYDGKKCRVCGETFNHLGQLKVHLSTEHPNEGIRCEFKCNICSREFTRKDHLKRHLMHVHKISEESLNSQKVSENHDRPKIIKPTKTSRPDIKPNAIKCKEYRERQKLKKKITDKSSKIPLEEPEIENPAVLSANVNNYSSHWPDYPEEDENEPIAIGDQNKETVAATNPFSSDDEEQRDFNNMNEYDVKQFVETIAHPEISIKVERPDYSYNCSSVKNETSNKSSNSSFDDININSKVTTLKPEKSEIDEEQDNKLRADDSVNHSFNDHFSDNQTSEEDTDEDYDQFGDDDEDESGSKSNKNLKISVSIKEETNVQPEHPSGSTASSKYTKVKAPRRRHGSSKTEDNRCKECNRSFTRYNHLLRHMLTHSDEKPHVCNFCGKGFSRSDHLQKHVQSIHCEKNYKCDQCSSAYGRKDHLLRHIETRHNKDPSVQKPQFDCDMCEKKFTTKAYLAKHKLLHTDRLYACKHCSETFPEKELMKEHQKEKHAQPRNFLCNICGDSFQRNEYLKIHMRRHTGEKPYKCRFCEKGFPRSTDLKMHERYHIGHKPNLCNLCGKGFHRPYNLTIHMRTHTGEKPYKCNQCPQAFAQSNDLKAHIRRHTGERFRCDICSAAFLQRYGLNAHLRTVHGIIVTSFTGRLRKTEQPVEDADNLDQQPNSTTLPTPLLSSEPLQNSTIVASNSAQEQAHSSLPSHIENNVSPPPLYLGHHFINTNTPTSPVVISSTASVLPVPLSLPSTQQM